ncbi:sarcosine oxidase subunit delta [Mesorhizobium sp. M7A.T.Ca.TU.009.01.3.2]|uniref:sarcosine oxidase subunit delta n=1 Tax=Mesorhizobium sp. M7A.F.Ca.MR.245.00.0.0 TaxID=2496778 RepID=UPI000FC9AA4F|nr:sarcosine oxidase subunit delta [Mesorhizobium sp. M7A.F.Ca.MR.245.00.0.0]RUU16243.1 sarcosine oxidase subunit delta [Mesorhizobium sp. M7A.T.Ca.TU.009.01.3.2]RUV12481.1 sarcosine oxidase subunit delta [Mesorhizobium sp. M7A.T.Ca.TU.009.01.3.1]RUV23699.1 sarcosine oxidase subunit delta [Mesorhizobium sp. M7A.F.Ca.MR.245.00.0.0]RUV50983.1 sarcosine oxidase subunit delta [Mesorhizobium sp. M7A.F.Ca.MR.228.00.0.0]
MKILTCPMNGQRNIDEFQSFGPVRAELDPDRAADADWSRHLFRAENRKGVVVEWWRHVPSNYFFLAERDLVTNEIIRTFDASEPRAQP